MPWTHARHGGSTRQLTAARVTHRFHRIGGDAVASERGSITIWIVTSAFIMIVLVGMAVDLGGQVYAQQHARDVARQAARVGGQQLQAAPAIRGEGAIADTARAAQAARTYLAASDVTGSAQVTSGDTIEVTTSSVYSTKFLSIIGINRVTVTGHAQATITRALEGVQR